MSSNYNTFYSPKLAEQTCSMYAYKVKRKTSHCSLDILVDSETAGLTDYTLLFDEYLLINVNCCEGDGILNANTQRHQLLSV